MLQWDEEVATGMATGMREAFHTVSHLLSHQAPTEAGAGCGPPLPRGDSMWHKVRLQASGITQPCSASAT